MGKSCAQEAMNQLKRLEKGGRPYPLQHYKQLRSHGDKRDFVQKLMLDLSACFLEAQERHFAETVNENESKTGWCYLWDIARLNGISYAATPEQDAFLAGLAEGCPTKDPEDGNMRAKLYKMYMYSKKYEGTEKLKSGKRMSVAATAKVQNAEEFQECVNLLGTPSSSTSKRPKTEKVPKDTEVQCPPKNVHEVVDQEPDCIAAEGVQI